MTKEEYQKTFSEEDAVGWLAIDEVFEKLYSKQEPKHFAPPIYYSVGGTEPLDGISIYESTIQTNHLHFVTYGFSELYYDDDNFDNEFSKWGFELTFRLEYKEYKEEDIYWVLSWLQNLAKYVFKSEKWFEEFQLIGFDQPLISENNIIVGLILVEDPEIGQITTSNGKVDFLQLIGLDLEDYNTIKVDKSKIQEFIKSKKISNPLLITS